MAIVRKTATVTLDAAGTGETDVNARPSNLLRHTALHAVRVAAATDGSRGLRVTLREVDVDTIANAAGEYEETEGETLCYLEAPTEAETYYPRKSTGTVDQFGAPLTTDGGPIPVDTDQVRVEVMNGAPSGTAVVYVFFETSGDQRF